jgi:type IV pilus biogenesis protein CpaD/CtpE
MRPLRTALLAAVLAAFAGCGGCDTVPTEAIQDCSQSAVFAGHVKTDILFVVDDSGR